MSWISRRRWWVVLPWLLAPLLSGWRWPGETNRLAASGQQAWQEGRFEEAAQAYGEALTAAGDSAQLAFNYGTALLQQGSYAAAVEALGRAAERTQDPALLDRVHYNRGNAFFRLGRIPEAAAAYRQALAADPQDEDAAYNLRLCEQRQQQQAAGGGANQPQQGGAGGAGGAGGGTIAAQPQGADPGRATPLTEAQVDQRLRALAQLEEDLRKGFRPRASALGRRDLPPAEVSVDEQVKQAQGHTDTVDW